MSGILDAWKESSVLQKIGLFAATGLATGAVIFGVYTLNSSKKQKRPPRAETPTRRVDPFEEEITPVTETAVHSQPPPSGPPPPSDPPYVAPPPQPQVEFSLTEKDVTLASGDTDSSSLEKPNDSLSASFEPISMSQVSETPQESLQSFEKISLPSEPEPPRKAESPEPEASGKSTSSESPKSESGSLSFVQLSIPESPLQSAESSLQPDVKEVVTEVAVHPDIVQEALSAPQEPAKEEEEQTVQEESVQSAVESVEEPADTDQLMAHKAAEDQKEADTKKKKVPTATLR